jgi:hypothetical protein
MFLYINPCVLRSTLSFPCYPDIPILSKHVSEQDLASMGCIIYTEALDNTPSIGPLNPPASRLSCILAGISNTCGRPQGKPASKHCDSRRAWLIYGIPLTQISGSQHHPTGALRSSMNSSPPPRIATANSAQLKSSERAVNGSI